MTASPTRRVIDFIAGATAEGLPPELLHAARRVFVDTLGVVVLGSAEESARILRQFAADEGARPRALALGSGLRTSPQLAALINGTAAHAIEFDDACAEGHLSAALVPAVLALAEDLGADGLRTLAAFCVGFEVAAKVGRSLLGDNYHHHWRGWHSTPATAVMGTAAAAAWLLRLNPLQTAHALGHCATYCAGFRKNFGTMTKPFHCGHAAQAGIVSAVLAKGGFTASAEILDAPLGYFDVLAEGHQDVRPPQGLGCDWALLGPGVNVRLYPSCYLTVRAADAVLREQGGLSVAPEAVTAIEIEMTQTEVNTLVYDLPQSGLEAKFSAQYVVAAAILDGALTPASFTDTQVRRPAAQQLMQRITKRSFDGNGPVRVTVRTDDGGEIVRRCDVPLGSAARPLDDEAIENKFRQCCGGILGEGAIDRALTLLRVLHDEPDIRVLTAQLVQGVS